MDEGYVSQAPSISDVLKALAQRKNVLLSGPPSCGKTHLMQAVADTFTPPAAAAPPSGPRAASGRIAIPAMVPVNTPQTAMMPSHLRSDRQVVRIAFSANTKARDFTSAFVPVVGAAGGMVGFRVETGALLKANALALGGAAVLLLIDELNRGPAVQLFGDAIVAIEPDKRLDANDRWQTNSWPMRVLDASGTTVDVHLSPHLYILASINMADTSIEALDVAFLRRFATIPVTPDADLARAHLGALGAGTVLPGAAATVADVTEAVIRAWESVNARIALGRSPDFQIGHGTFFDPPVAPITVNGALEAAIDWWGKIHTHVAEVFYGDVIGLGVALNVGGDPAGYQLVNAPYGQDDRQQIVAPVIDPGTIYGVLKRISGA